MYLKLLFLITILKSADLSETDYLDYQLLTFFSNKSLKFIGIGIEDKIFNDGCKRDKYELNIIHNRHMKQTDKYLYVEIYTECPKFTMFHMFLFRSSVQNFLNCKKITVLLSKLTSQ